MSNSPEVVSYYIPLMKHLNMTWEEIKRTPRFELQGLLLALQEYNILHSFDGYNRKEIAEMQKDNPELANQYSDYMERRRKYGLQKTEVRSFSEL